MKNENFEIALFKHLYFLYKLNEAEEYLQKCKIKPLLAQDVPVAAISKYFRLMNIIDYSKLSFFDKRHINKFFSNKTNHLTAHFDNKTLNIFKKVTDHISVAKKGYTLYNYDGSASDSKSISGFCNGSAPNNHITFGLYYTQFDENTEVDEFRNYNIIAELSNRLQQKNIAIVSFSEIDVYKQLAVNP